MVIMLAPGVVLGRFHLLSPLGRGGMGEVWRAHDPRLDRDVAIKVLPQWLESTESIARFEREARALAALNHPNVAQIYEVGEAQPSRGDGSPAAGAAVTRFLVMELVEGESLAARIRREPPAVHEGLHLGLAVARAVAAAHARGVIHRDLKPANVMLTAEGVPKVLDFGLARLRPRREQGGDADVTAALADSGVVVGTASYMSPEQVRGEECDERCDVWAFACCLGEILGGARLFDAPTLPEIVARVLSAEPDLSHLPRATPREVISLIRFCLAAAARSRPAMDEVTLRIERAVARLETPPFRRAALPWLATSAAGLALAGALAFLAMRLGGGDEVRTGPAPPLRVTVEPARAPADDVAAAQLGRRAVASLQAGLGTRRGLEVVSGGDGVVVVRTTLTPPFPPRGDGAAIHLTVAAVNAATAALLGVVERDAPVAAPDGAIDAAVAAVGDALELEAAVREMAAEDPLHGYLARRTRSVVAARAFQQGLAAYTRTRWREARSGFDAALAADPSFWPGELYKAMVAKSTGRFDEWQAPLAAGRALLAHPEPAEAAFADMVAAIVAEDQERVLQAIEQARAAFPGSGQLAYAAARAYRRQDRPEKAIPLLEKLIAAGWQPDWSPTREELAYNLVLAGRFAEALAVAAAAEERSPRRHPPPLYQALALEQLGRGEEAREALARAVRKRLDFSPTDPLVVHQAAQWWASLLRWSEEQRRQWEAILAEAEKQLRDDPSDAALLQARGEALAGLGRHAEAAAVLEPLVAATPEEPYLFLALNRARLGTGDRAGAAAARERAAELWRRGDAPALGTLAYNIACAWLLADDLEEGTAWLLRARDQYGFDRVDLALDPELDPLRRAGRLADLRR
jgi:tetratricopeptide (TPR) repeat protein